MHEQGRTTGTLYEKLWESHVVHQEADGTTLLYSDLHDDPTAVRSGVPANKG